MKVSVNLGIIMVPQLAFAAVTKQVSQIVTGIGTVKKEGSNFILVDDKGNKVVLLGDTSKIASFIYTKVTVSGNVIASSTGNIPNKLNVITITKYVAVSAQVSGTLKYDVSTGVFTVAGYVLRTNNPSIIFKYINKNVSVTGTETKTSTGKPAIQVSVVKLQ